MKRALALLVGAVVAGGLLSVPAAAGAAPAPAAATAVAYAPTLTAHPAGVTTASGSFGNCLFNYSTGPGPGASAPKAVTIGVHVKGVTFYIWFEGECGAIYWFRLHPEVGTYTQGITGTGQAMVFDPLLMRFTTSGAQHMVLDISWSGNPAPQTVDAGYLHIRRNTRVVGFNCGPEPARYGYPMDCTGILEVASWNGALARYVRFSHQLLALIFKEHGLDWWVGLGGDTTGKHGHFSVTVHPQQSGTYMVLYQRSNHTVDNAFSTHDHVAVV